MGRLNLGIRRGRRRTRSSFRYKIITPSNKRFTGKLNKIAGIEKDV